MKPLGWAIIAISISGFAFVLWSATYAFTFAPRYLIPALLALFAIGMVMVNL